MTNTGDAGPNQKWLRGLADIEDSCRSVSVGGMAADLGLLSPVQAKSQRVFGRLIAFVRRAKGLSVEQLADQAGVRWAGRLW